MMQEIDPEHELPSALPHREVPRCPGLILDWPTRDFWGDYPFHRHDDSVGSLGYRFCSVEKDGRFRVQSSACCGVPMPDGGACPECQKIAGVVEHLADLSQNAERHTNRRYLSHNQLSDTIEEQNGIINKAKLKVCFSHSCAEKDRC